MVREDVANHWNVRLHRHGGWLPWHAHITHGIAMLGEPGSTTYASRTPHRACQKAMRTIAKVAPEDEPGEIRITIEGWG